MTKQHRIVSTKVTTAHAQQDFGQDPQPQIMVVYSTLAWAALDHYDMPVLMFTGHGQWVQVQPLHNPHACQDPMSKGYGEFPAPFCQACWREERDWMAQMANYSNFPGWD